jgi:hypothetical protein
MVSGSWRSPVVVSWLLTKLSLWLSTAAVERSGAGNGTEGEAGGGAQWIPTRLDD